MRLIVWLVLVTACERSGPVETSESTTSAPREPEAARPAPPHVAGTLPNDAGVTPAVTDAAIAKATPDPKPSARAIDDEARSYANILAIESSDPANAGDMTKRRPGADLGKQVQDARSTGRISVASKQALDESTLTPDAALSKIQSVYLMGIKRCYKNHLKTDPTAKGKLKLSFTVNETGRAINGKAIGFAKPIDDCITGQIAGWRFPVPKDKDGESTQASFDFGLTLIPD